MTLNEAIEKRAAEKLAGFMDNFGSMYDSISGNNGTLSTGLMGLGGAALGGMAGKGLGVGALGTGVGALLGGGMAAAGSNALNMQNAAQDNMDKALINGVSAGLMANDQTDMMQNEAISQNNMMMGQIIDSLNGIGSMLMGGGMVGSSPFDQGMDPSMMGGMEDPMGESQTAQAPAKGNPSRNQVENNGLGTVKKSGLYNDIAKTASLKINTFLNRLK